MAWRMWWPHRSIFLVTFKKLASKSQNMFFSPPFLLSSCKTLQTKYMEESLSQSFSPTRCYPSFEERLDIKEKLPFGFLRALSLLSTSQEKRGKHYTLSIL